MEALKRLRRYFFLPTKTPTQKGKRFLKADEPEEKTYRDLLESTPFFLETEDRAKEDVQGLVHKATNEEAKAYNETELTTKTKAIVPSQLPELKPKDDTIEEIDEVDIPAFQGNVLDISIAANEGQDSNFSKRNVFLLGLSTSFNEWLRNALNYLYGNFTNILSFIGIAGGNAGQVLTKNSNSNGDYSWVTLKTRAFVVIEIDGTNQINRLLFPFNATISLSNNTGATINSPILPFSYVAGNVFEINTTGTNQVITLLVTEI